MEVVEVLDELLKTINPNNPYAIQARNMGKFGVVPTTKGIESMANWDIKNREMELQEAARRANDALNFYNIQDIPDMITPDNPYYSPLTGAVGQGLVPTNLFQSALTEQGNMGRNQAVADLVRQFQGMVTPETPQHIQAIINATAQNPDAFKRLVDPIFEHFGDVHAAQQQALEDERLAAAERERRENVIRTLRELGVSDDIATLLFEPELKDLKDIVISNIKSQFPDRESQLKIKKLEADIKKIEADTAYTQSRTEGLTNETPDTGSVVPKNAQEQKSLYLTLRKMMDNADTMKSYLRGLVAYEPVLTTLIGPDLYQSLYNEVIDMTGGRPEMHFGRNPIPGDLIGTYLKNLGVINRLANLDDPRWEVNLGNNVRRR
jgi:hypothetical protein